MQRFIEFLIQNPLVAILLLGWLLGMVGKSLKGAVEKSQGQRSKGSRSASGPPPTSAAPQTQARRARSQAPTGGPTSPMAGPPVGRQAPSPEEVAAEMRRILGMDPPKKGAEPGPAQAARQAKPPAVRPVEAARSAPSPAPLVQPRSTRMPSMDLEERAFQARVARDESTSAVSQAAARIDSNLGERIASRRGPMSGGVGQTLLGGLGGRTRTQAVKGPMRGSRLVDVRDMARAIVMREILDPPVGMRDLG